MKRILNSFKLMIHQVGGDYMLIVLMLVPVIVGVVFKFAVPLLNQWISEYFNLHNILTPYYEIIDVFLILLTGMMFNYIAAMTILDEFDDGIINFLSVMPLTKIGYLISRLGIIFIISVFASIIISAVFSLKEFNLLLTILLSIISAVQGSIIALLIVSISSNKVEGMAVGKMTALFFAGIFAPYFIDSVYQYLFAVLPSYWVGKTLVTGNLVHLLTAFVISLIWLLFLSKKFRHKI